ncbi:MAG: [FeFe] hydrogenase H-cluster radical SAM maturase HydG, partial [Myxococcales bacterium]|nr:[FeFe] hydrogenase H-cluster radical SAM maturase HydG [Myxococcales bacterium]
MLANIRRLSPKFRDFIDDPSLEALVGRAPPDAHEIEDIVQRSLSKEPLSVMEVAALLAIRDEAGWSVVLDAARELKRAVYGDRMVLFAPFYVGNECVNDCTYCSYRRSNDAVTRHTLSPDEL